MTDSNPRTEQEIFEIVAAKIAEQKDIEPSAVGMDATFESLAVDSLDGIRGARARFSQGDSPANSEARKTRGGV